MNDKNIKLFKRFLKETKAYKSFFRHYDPDFMQMPESVVEYLKCASPMAVIDDAFDWEETGNFDYWDNLEMDWRDFYRIATESSISDALIHIGIT